MGFIKGEPREQLVLYAEALDDIIGEEDPVRFIDVFVDKLDLKSLGFKMKEAETGRNPYQTGLMLKIYMYGYLNKIRSSRKLEKECNRNIELIWLTGRLAPDFKTIADFRRDNKKGIKSIFKEFLKICNKAGLLSFELVGIDGTKISGQNHNNNVYHRKNLGETLQKLEQRIEDYLKVMDKNDTEESNEFEFLKENIEDRLKHLKNKKEKLEAIEKIFEADPDMERHFANDPESRFMHNKGKVDVGYNVQSAVDNKNKLIVAIDVTQENNDIKQMNGMCGLVEEVKKELNIVKDTIKVADAGYYSEPQILECLDNGHNVYMPNPKDEHIKRAQNDEEKSEKSKAGYQIKDFKYDPKRDVYICPKGEVLRRRGNIKKAASGKLVMRYTCYQCLGCSVRNLCTESKEGRSMKVPIRNKEIEKFKVKIGSEMGKKIIGKRKEICEHPFGSIKRNMGYTYFLMKGKDSALMEASLVGFAHNFTRAMSLLGMKKLLKLV